ncbi:molecular chaperone TorD family protein [Parasutterella muris]|nr:molecular chaperone TorD family protein [Parasutterella muris]
MPLPSDLSLIMQTSPLNLVLVGLFEPSDEIRELHVFNRAAESLEDGLAEKARLLDALYSQGTRDKQAFEEMLLEYTRLFLSPGQPLARNYLTCWKNELGSNVLEDYLSYLQSKGFEIEEDVRELPEHIVPVLEVYELLDEEEKQEFFEKFLSNFILKWSSLLTEETTHKFYKELGKFFFEWGNLEAKKYGKIS